MPWDNVSPIGEGAGKDFLKTSDLGRADLKRLLARRVRNQVPRARPSSLVIEAEDPFALHFTDENPGAAEVPSDRETCKDNFRKMRETPSPLRPILHNLGVESEKNLESSAIRGDRLEKAHDRDPARF